MHDASLPSYTASSHHREKGNHLIPLLAYVKNAYVKKMSRRYVKPHPADPRFTALPRPTDQRATACAKLQRVENDAREWRFLRVKLGPNLDQLVFYLGPNGNLEGNLAKNLFKINGRGDRGWEQPTRLQFCG